MSCDASYFASAKRLVIQLVEIHASLVQYETAVGGKGKFIILKKS